MALAALGVFYGGVIVGIPVVTGVAEGVAEQKKQNEEANNEERMVKFYIDVFCSEKSSKAKEVDGGIVVLRDDKVWIVPKDKDTGLPANGEHPFQGFYIQYPDESRNPPERGLVSTIPGDQPMLNWIYVDSQTYELKYGNRTASIQHIVGPWDWTEEDHQGLLLEDWEGFVAVEEDEGWAVYYDQEDDRLNKGKLVGGKRVLQCSLERRVFDENKQNQEMEEANKKLQVKSRGDLKTKWG